MNNLMLQIQLKSIQSLKTQSSGPGFIKSVLEKFDIKYNVSESSKANIPATGAFIIIANHPLGIIDELILLRILCEKRSDFKLFGGNYLNQISSINDHIIPTNAIENTGFNQISYNGIKAVFKHISAGSPIGIFPSGEVSSKLTDSLKTNDRQWQKASIRFIQKAGVQVIPVFINSSNGNLFNIMGQMHPLLRSAKIPSEVLNIGRQSLEIVIGKPITTKTIECFTTTNSLSVFLRAKTYFLSNSVTIETFFNAAMRKKEEPKQNIIEPIDPELLLTDINQISEECFLFTKGNYSVYCAPFNQIPNIIREIGRLREITFREIGEGTNKSIDLEQYDIYYNHLFIWDNEKKKIAGSYRIGKGKDILNQYGKNGFYISSLFKIKKGFLSVLDKSLELGRSFIVMEYQRQPMSLFLLWKGILWYLIKNPHYQYLIGPVSISNDYSKQSKSLIEQFIKENYFDFSLSTFIVPRNKFKIPKGIYNSNRIILEGIDDDIKILDLWIKEFQPGLSVPVLIKKYLQMNGRIIGFNIDPDFNNCLDGLMFVNISDIPAEMIETLAKELENSQLKDRFLN